MVDRKHLPLIFLNTRKHIVAMDDVKEQPDNIAVPADAPPGSIVSPDTYRQQRIPPGQSRTRKWPVLDAGGPPRVDLNTWKLNVFGLVGSAVEWTWRDFAELPRVRVFADFHCVTRWSRLGNVWEGVSTREIMARAGGPRPETTFVLAHGYDRGFTTNVPLADFLAEDALIAITHDGEPLSLNHGGPARLIVPQLYAWKSAKWLRSIELLQSDQAGFWESNGYHMRGNPWKEQRHGW
jgi:DMSO/TMAO reductase YedYZ molybdopterin-dependent catalytic subunit